MYLKSNIHKMFSRLYNMNTDIWNNVFNQKWFYRDSKIQEVRYYKHDC